MMGIAGYEGFAFVQNQNPSNGLDLRGGYTLNQEKE